MDGSIADQTSVIVGQSCMPVNFSWVIDRQLCGLGFPGSDSNLQYLLDQGVTGLLSLTAERVPEVSSFPDIELHQVKVQDFTAPTDEQIRECIDFIEEHVQKNGAAAVHCAHGKGRTGTILACYLAKRYNITGPDAIRKVRLVRPGSVETLEQEDRVVEYVDRHFNGQ